MTRIDSASRLIAASPDTIYQAFTTPGAMERWLPPGNMRADMLHFDFREGGSYRMRLTYTDPAQGEGKSARDFDEVEVKLVRLEAGRTIGQEIRFESDDSRFSGVMRMTWSFEPGDTGTRVTIRAEGIPKGIRPDEHTAGFKSSLENLARFVEAGA